MDSTELKATASLASVFAFRMLGLFMVLPVLAIYGDELQGASPALIGVAIGGYGLTQALLQIPFGMLSDRIGRKPVIIAGLLLFAAGSLLAAGSESIYGVIAGRCLQGAGAIASTVLALLSDLTREQNRTRAMALVGMSIGLSFCVAMVAGPLITAWFGLTGLFLVTALLSLFALMIILWLVPTPRVLRSHSDTLAVPGQFRKILSNPQLLRLDFGIFMLHAVLMALFVAVPQALVSEAGLPREQHWWVYLLCLLTSFFAMVPFIILGEKKRQLKAVFVGAVGLLTLSELSFLVSYGALWPLIGSLFLFFMAFNLLEATLPSLISKLAPAGSKGTAMGVYSTGQFLGAALGGMAGGVIYQYYGFEGVFALAAIGSAIWFAFSATMAQPPYLSSMVVGLGAAQDDPETVAAALTKVLGVVEVVVIREELAAYLKVDNDRLDTEALAALGVIAD
ncbi:MFS transporter [Aestuariirhabdus sp. Z084]|uniref:MFS transporter n=1 Tax=Aestuariirhabdus haliotis TaxID=2918751 RepID=UPI00201B3556|nr:MFS transporter [Aestuariirhabdus haliotis]MCL6417193.1 MFS transporter [Aestuariirhabdus haliotis]MCL6421165.1 MFS transporter [Aestuariirhabdus haliotis]